VGDGWLPYVLSALDWAFMSEAARLCRRDGLLVAPVLRAPCLQIKFDVGLAKLKNRFYFRMWFI
jgi:hypothetical protein